MPVLLKTDSSAHRWPVVQVVQSLGYRGVRCIRWRERLAAVDETFNVDNTPIQESGKERNDG
jgi:hypothetical protein